MSFQNHTERNVYTAQKPSPWPFVGGMLVMAALLSTLLVAFGN